MQVTKRRQERNQEMKHQHGRKKHMQQAVHSLPCAWTDQPGLPLVVHWSRSEQLQTKPNEDGTGREGQDNPCMAAGPMEREGRDDAAEKPLLVRVGGSGGSQGGSASSSSVAVVVGSTAIAVAGSFEFGMSVIIR